MHVQSAQCRRHRPAPKLRLTWSGSWCRQTRSVRPLDGIEEPRAVLKLTDGRSGCRRPVWTSSKQPVWYQLLADRGPDKEASEGCHPRCDPCRSDKLTGDAHGIDLDEDGNGSRKSDMSVSLSITIPVNRGLTDLLLALERVQSPVLGRFTGFWRLVVLENDSTQCTAIEK